MNFFLRLVLTLILFPTILAADNYPRNERIDILHYTFKITLDDQTDEIMGETTIDVRFLADGITELGLDLIGKASEQTGMHVGSVFRNEKSIAFSHTNNRIVIKLMSPSQAGEHRSYSISYRGIPADGLIISQNKYNERTFFGDNWPDRARHWLPTVDHPSDKATCDFIIIAPNHYQVIGNGSLREETDLDDHTRLTHWHEAVPIPTKVMVIGVARFAVETVFTYEGIPIQSWVYPQDREPGFYDYAQAIRVIQFFSSHIGPYPYEKLANVQSKTRYGGMENAGNIFYSERSVTGKRRSESLIAHEVAHQWFGDSVTEADWHHIWLSEGFATYFTQLYMEFTYGRDKMIGSETGERRSMKGSRQRVIKYFNENPASPIVDTTITDLNLLLNANSYQKGGWVLHMLRHVVGDEAFWQGIREFYKQFRDSNALTEDFQQKMEEASGKELSWFFRQWIYQPGHPKFEGSWKFDENKKELVVILNQTQETGVLFTMPVDLGIYTEDEGVPRIEVLKINQKKHDFTFPVDKKPKKVKLDPNTWLLLEADFKEKLN